MVPARSIFVKRRKRHNGWGGRLWRGAVVDVSVPSVCYLLVDLPYHSALLELLDFDVFLHVTGQYFCARKGLTSTNWMY
jgi:hypothetical protein